MKKDKIRIQLNGGETIQKLAIRNLIGWTETFPNLPGIDFVFDKFFMSFNIVLI